MNDKDEFGWDHPSYRIETSSEVIQNRKSICDSCDNLKLGFLCNQCGCFMPMKVRLSGEGVKCPLGKW